MWSKTAWSPKAWGKAWGDAIIVTPEGLKFWNGSAWAIAQMRVWTGTDWAAKPVRRWDGSAWRDV